MNIESVANRLVELGQHRDSGWLLRAAWLRPKQTDLVPSKGQLRSRFHHPLSYCCPPTIFLLGWTAPYGIERARL